MGILRRAKTTAEVIAMISDGLIHSIMREVRKGGGKCLWPNRCCCNVGRWKRPKVA